jgi:DNA-binding PadR family transcriptional regulator
LLHRRDAGQALKGHLDLLLLAGVGAGPVHGYALIERLRRLSGGVFDLPEGTVYPALRRLEVAGAVRSGWSEVPGRRRRVYALTDAGRGALAERRATWRRFAAAVEAVLRPIGAPA